MARLVNPTPRLLNPRVDDAAIPGMPPILLLAVCVDLPSPATTWFPETCGRSACPDRATAFVGDQNFPVLVPEVADYLRDFRQITF